MQVLYSTVPFVSGMLSRCYRWRHRCAEIFMRPTAIAFEDQEGLPEHFSGSRRIVSCWNFPPLASWGIVTCAYKLSKCSEVIGHCNSHKRANLYIHHAGRSKWWLCEIQRFENESPCAPLGAQLCVQWHMPEDSDCLAASPLSVRAVLQIPAAF